MTYECDMMALILQHTRSDAMEYVFDPIMDGDYYIWLMERQAEQELLCSRGHADTPQQSTVSDAQTTLPTNSDKPFGEMFKIRF